MRLKWGLIRWSKSSNFWQCRKKPRQKYIAFIYSIDIVPTFLDQSFALNNKTTMGSFRCSFILLLAVLASVGLRSGDDGERTSVWAEWQEARIFGFNGSHDVRRTFRFISLIANPHVPCFLLRFAVVVPGVVSPLLT